jgi:WD40 repeat protein
MSTTVRHAPPARRALMLILAALLAVLSLAGSLPLSAAAQSGSNDELANKELFTKAISNMNLLTSYRVEFGSEATWPGEPQHEVLTLAGNIQRSGNGSLVAIHYAPGPPGADITLLTNSGKYVRGTTDFALTDRNMYFSADNGKNWTPVVDYSPVAILSPMCMWWGGVCWMPVGVFQNEPTSSMFSDLLLKYGKFVDASPLLEQIDGVPTRHMVITLSNALDTSATVQVWVSTERTPTIRQIRQDFHQPSPAQLTGPANALAFRPDGKILAVAHGNATDPSIRFWDLSKPGSLPTRLAPSETSPSNAPPGIGYTSLAFSPNGQQLWAGQSSARGTLTMFDVITEFQLDRITPNIQAVYGLAMRLDGRQLAGATAKGVYLWDPSQNLEAGTLLAGSEDRSYRAVAYSLDSRTLAASTTEGIWLFDLNQPAGPPALLMHPNAHTLAFSPDGHWLAAIRDSQAGDEGNTIRLWDLQAPSSVPTVLPGGAGDGVALAFSPDSRLLAASGTPGTLRLWDLDQSRLSPTIVAVSDKPVSTLAFSPDGATLAAASLDGAVRLWNVADLRQTAPASPTILRAPDRAATVISGTLTWHWSRFNEDFGKVEITSDGKLVPAASPTPSVPSAPVGMPVTGQPLIWPLAVLLAWGLVLVEAGASLRRRRGPRRLNRGRQPSRGRVGYEIAQ